MCICGAFKTPLEGVNVYGRPEAGDSRQVKLFLEDRGVRFKYTDISQDADGLAHMQTVSGQQDAVVVEIGKKIFVGYTPVELDCALP